MANACRALALVQRVQAELGKAPPKLSSDAARGASVRFQVRIRGTHLKQTARQSGRKSALQLLGASSVWRFQRTQRRLDAALREVGSLEEALNEARSRSARVGLKVLEISFAAQRKNPSRVVSAERGSASEARREDACCLAA